MNLITKYKMYENMDDPYGEEIDETKVKPVLRKAERMFFVVDYNDFDRFVQQVYGDRNYEFCAVQEANNDSYYRFNVTGRVPDYNQRDAQRIRDGHIDTYRNHLLFNVLCQDGYIEPGTYLVEVSW